MRKAITCVRTCYYPHATTGREGDCEKVSRAKKSTSQSCKEKLTKPAAELNTGNHRSCWSICMWHRFFLGGRNGVRLQCFLTLPLSAPRGAYPLDLHSPPNHPVCLSWAARREQWKDITHGQDLGFFTIVFDCSIVRAFVICCPGYAPPAFADSLYYLLVATPKGLLQLSDVPNLLRLYMRAHAWIPTTLETSRRCLVLQPLGIRFEEVRARVHVGCCACEHICLGNGHV